ncbi:DNA polymerase III subunit alpha [Thiomicrorhabdus xiamenensis]|uniref:DNA polymerase III subunit alpha n=1 Tax=Thiomicrorhabdus xiamenensis TaxID=2739063 RepID=A0A7D4NKB0_9GAMM|nr:DNA polymerase III subunit alpha [Thiomicrorhabdus xiamenensis]QKI89089.1 DNA polymerase III subunit alpha [Thiomicrorhabdus xiamenensis]
MPQFVHLHLHSEYSVIDGTLGIKPLVSLAQTDNQPAVALTDINNMFALVKFYGAAMGAGIKPVLGAEVLIEDEQGAVFPVVLLVQNEQGYLNLSHMISQSNLHHQKTYQYAELGMIPKTMLAELNEGLIALSAGRLGDVGSALLSQNQELIEERLNWWREYFPDRYYLELIRTDREHEEAYIQLALQTAEQWQLPVVATNDVRFAREEDFEAHEVRTCIHDGFVLEDPKRPKRYSPQQYFRTSEEMVALFADIPEAIANTVEIAKRCSLNLTLGTYFLPDFPIPEGMTMDEFFVQESHKGLDERLAFLFGGEPVEIQQQKRQEYYDRIKFELDIILQMGFPGYFLIVADFIQWAKNHQIPVGPGRGSGAGSLVAYALKITDLDPIEYDLLFERFLNPERVSMPDFDVDFCMDRRDEVIDYVSRHYGRDHVSQIVTFGTMAAKAVVRDVGRVLGLGYGAVDGIAKLIPNELGIKLKDAIEQEPDMQAKRDSDEDAAQLLELALKLEGTVRNTGKHAGGVVIGPKPLDHFCPLSCEVDGSGVVTQLDKNDVEYAGLVKFDFLGLRTLTIIDWALQSINGNKQPGDEGFLDIARIPIDDEPTFDLIKTGKTTGIFQLESSGMQNLIVKLRPDCFEDIIALVALFRPGPLDSGMVDNFINRKHGKEAVAYPDPQYQHESLQPILEPTYGVILYQEQVMQIAQVLAGYSLGGADLLRRAMGKKKPEEMAKQRSVFKEGAIGIGVDGDLAMKIFDLVEKFAGYGFNKSHSAAYALVSYQSAWLKTHYPAEFMAAQISSDMDNTEKVVHMVNECLAMTLTVLPPNINTGEIHFKPYGDRTVNYGLGAIKGVGGAALEGVIAERRENGPFKDLFDFCLRAGKKVNKRVVEALVRSGAMDVLHGNRQAMLETIPTAMKQAEQQLKNNETGQNDLFGDMFAEEQESTSQLADVAEMSQKLRLKGEKETLGLYMTGHPIDIYQDEINGLVDSPLIQMKPERWKKRWGAGLVVDLRVKITKKGTKMAIVTIDDKTSRMDVTMRPAIYEQIQNELAVDKVIMVYGEVREDTFNGGVKFEAEQIVSLAEARVEKGLALELNVTVEELDEQRMQTLQQMVSPFCNEIGLPLQIQYRNQQAQALLKTRQLYYPDDDLLEVLNAQGWQPKVLSR